MLLETYLFTLTTLPPNFFLTLSSHSNTFLILPLRPGPFAFSNSFSLNVKGHTLQVYIAEYINLSYTTQKNSGYNQYFSDNIYAHSHLHFPGKVNALFSKNL